MSVRTQMKRFGALAIQIRERKELSNEQLDYLAEAFEKISTKETTKQALFSLYEMALEKLSTTEDVDENNNMLDQTQLEHIEAEQQQKIGVTIDMFCCEQ